MIRVEFLKPWRNYNRGEVAAFDQHMVDALLSGGWAVLADAVAGQVVAEPVVAGDADLPEQGAGGSGDEPAPAGRKKPAAALPEQGAGA